MAQLTIESATEERRQRLIAALQERAELLRPAAELLEAGLRRCQPRTTSVELEPTTDRTSRRAPVVGTEPPSVPADAPSPAKAPAMDGTEISAFDEGPRPAAVQATVDGTGRWEALKPGRVMAGYRIESLIGHGGMGHIYRATQLSMNRQVAFKVLSQRLTDQPRLRERFLREARAAGRLHHPNLIGVHDVGVAEGMMFFSMELVEGITLKQLIIKLEKVPEPQALHFCRQILEALRYAHAQGLVHRDIKPDNLMLTREGVVKVADLGLSRTETVDEDDCFITQEGALMGSPHYMAPEQSDNAHAVDHRADLYAVGATLYHLVCGACPFTGESSMEVIVNASTQPLRFPEPGPSLGMRDLIRRFMAKSPADRPQSAEDALALITHLRRRRAETDPEQGQGLGSAVDRVRARRLRRFLRRLIWGGVAITIAVAGAVLLTLLIGHLQWLRIQEETARLTDAHRYPEALTAIDRYGVGRNPLQSGSVDLRGLRTGVEKAWDAWATAQATPGFEEFHDEIMAHRWSEAEAALSGIDAAWRSPAVRRDLESCQKQLHDAMRPANDDTGGAAKLTWQREFTKRFGRDFWNSFTTTVKTGPAVRDEVACFTGIGGGTSQHPVILGRRMRGLELVFSVRLSGTDQGAWGFNLMDSRQLMVVREGLVMRDRPRPDRLLAPPGNDGAIFFALRHTGSDLELRVHEREIGGWQPLGLTAVERMTVKWELSAGQTAEVRLAPVLEMSSAGATPGNL